MRNTLQALGLALVFVSTTASAGVWVGGGIEYLSVGSYLDYSSGGVNKYADLGRESGFIPFVEANTDFPVTEKLGISLAGHAYGGSIDYSSRSISPSLKSKMDYKGVRGEVGVTYTPFPHGENSDLAFVANLGYDTFTRKLKVTDEEEEWKTPFLRLGAQMTPSETNPWSAKGGLLVPMQTTFRYKPTSTTYHPEPSTSFYLGFGRRFTRFVEVGLNYETVRFSSLDASEKVYATPRVETESYQLYLKVGI